MRRCGERRRPRRHRIRIDTVSLSTDGENTETWATFADNVPAEVMYRAGGERISGVQVAATATRVIKCEPLANITPQMRVYHYDESATYHIISHGDPTGMGREMLIQCTEDQG